MKKTVFLRRHEVIHRTGLARATLYQAILRGTFPKPIQIGPRAVAWLESDIEQWQADKIKASRGGQAA